MRKIVALVLILFTALGFSQAQPNRKGVEWTIKEKFKVKPELAVLNYYNESGEEMPESVREFLNYTDVPIVSSLNIDAEVHAAVNPADSQNILASPIRQTSTSLQTPIYYTKNFGGTWSKSSFNPMPSYPGAYQLGGGDPVLAFDNTGRAYFSWLELHVRNVPIDTIYWGLYWAYSDDGGVNWVRPQHSTVSLAKVEYATQVSDKPVTDKQWMATDRSNSVFKNNLYMSYVEIDLNTTEYRIVVHTKPADSMAFNPSPVVITDASFTLCQFASLDIDINGHVHVSFFGTKDNSNYGIYHSRSTDGGATFSSPVLVSPIQMPRFSAGQENESVVGISDDRLYPSCYLAANTVSNNIYITWSANGINTKLNNGLDVYFSTSSDGGITWSPPKIVNNDQGGLGKHQYYSSISCGIDGNVVLGWYDRRDDTNNVVAHYYFTESFNHGSTFLPSYQVTSAGTDFSKVGLSNSDFGIGEYTQILGLKDYIIPVWTDGRTNNGNLNIYVAFINRKTMNVEQLTGVNNNLGIINIYPNPAQADVKVDFSLEESSTVEIMLYDQTGRTVSILNTGKFDSGRHTVTGNLSGISNGGYYIMVKSGYETFSRKILVNR